MTAAIAFGARRHGPANVGMAAAGLAIAVLLVVGQEQFRRAEAFALASLVKLLGIFPASSIGIAVTFPTEGRYVGLAVSPSCTAALLIVPFVALTSVLLLAGGLNLGEPWLQSPSLRRS